MEFCTGIAVSASKTAGQYTALAAQKEVLAEPAARCRSSRDRKVAVTFGTADAYTYGDRRLWITFWRKFWGVFWGDFLQATGPGAGVRGDFSADGVPLVRWASADLGPFSHFFAFLVRFLPVFGPHFALFPSMSCAYLYVHNFRRTRASRSRRRGIRGRRANLASDKETVVDGRGLTAKGAKDAKGESGDDKRRKAKPPQGRRARRNWAGKISHLTKKQQRRLGERGEGETAQPSTQRAPATAGKLRTQRGNGGTASAWVPAVEPRQARPARECLRQGGQISHLTKKQYLKAGV